MRLFIALSAVLGTILAGAGAPAFVAADGGYVLAAQEQPAPQPPAQPGGELDVDVQIGESGGGWFADPIWIAIGVIGVVLLIVVVAVAARGGGTTVIRD